MLGERAPLRDLPRLPYLDQILKESLRLWPTAPAFTVSPHEDTTIGGSYAVPRGETLLVLTPALHRDPAVWGSDAGVFDPDRFAFERAATLPPNAWKPFGNGQRSCIGRGFALQEAALFLAMLLQRFDITPADPDYQLKIKQTLTIKPEGLHIYARRRDTRIIATAEAAGGCRSPPRSPPRSPGPQRRPGPGALRLQRRHLQGVRPADRQRRRPRGYTPTMAPLDSIVKEGAEGDPGPGLPAEGVVAIVTSSYEGQPPDNARRFVGWAAGLAPGSWTGSGTPSSATETRDWARTYQAVPTAIDARLAAAGATRVYRRGAADARADFFGDFEELVRRLLARRGRRAGAGHGRPARAAPAGGRFVGSIRDPLLRQNGPPWAPWWRTGSWWTPPGRGPAPNGTWRSRCRTA